MSTLQLLFGSLHLLDALALAVFLLILVLFTFFVVRQRSQPAPRLRPIAAYKALQDLLAGAVETGRRVHLSVGIAGIGGARTADTTAGLDVLGFLSDRAAVNAIPPIVTVSDPTALPVAQDQLRRAYSRQGFPGEYDPRQTRWIAPPVNGSAVPYAAGVMDILAHEDVMANVMVGSFGDEFLLMSETGARRGLLQAGGTSDPYVLPFAYASVTHPLLGEEIYAAGAYLGARASHFGSLLAQDAVRFLLIALAVLAILARSFGWI